MANKVTWKLTTFQEQDQSEKLLTSHSVKCVNRRERNSRRFAALVLLPRVQLEQYFILKIQYCGIDQPKTTCKEVEAEPAVKTGRHRLVLLDFHQSASFANLTLDGANNKVAHNR